MKDINNMLMYLFWCAEHGYHPSLCSSEEAWGEYLYGAREHRGDCTKDSCPCIRCHMQEYEIKAQTAIDYLEHECKGSWLKLIELRERK